MLIFHSNSSHCSVYIGHVLIQLIFWLQCSYCFFTTLCFLYMMRGRMIIINANALISGHPGITTWAFHRICQLCSLISSLHFRSRIDEEHPGDFQCQRHFADGAGNECLSCLRKDQVHSIGEHASSGKLATEKTVNDFHTYLSF